MRWWSYVTQVSGGNQTEIAYKVGVSVPSVSRWRTSAPKPQNVVAFARAYDRPVIEAFIAAGYLTEADAQQKVVVDRKASDLSDSELVAEVDRRIRQARESLSKPDPDTSAPDYPVGFTRDEEVAATRRATVRAVREREAKRNR